MDTRKLTLPLLFTRLSIFIVFLIWTLDKFINPDHSAAVFSTFYFLTGLEPAVLYIIGAIQMVIISAFILGFKKKYSYGAVLILHAISTVSSWKMYTMAFSKGPAILFFAAIPMLAACYILFLLREYDTKYTLDE